MAIYGSGVSGMGDGNRDSMLKKYFSKFLPFIEHFFHHLILSIDRDLHGDSADLSKSCHLK